MKAPTISIINWEKYQHYKDRNPPWIKLYHSLLDDYEYSCLQDDSKLLLISLYLLAGRKNNLIPYDKEWIKNKAMLKGIIDIDTLVSYGFIRINGKDNLSDSKLIAGCKQSACLETETETEKIKIYSELENVKLTESEFAKLNKKFGTLSTKQKIEDLSNYIASKGKQYKSHYATILAWDRRDKKRQSQSLKPKTYAQAQDAERRGRAAWLKKEMENDNQESSSQGIDETVPMLPGNQV